MSLYDFSEETLDWLGEWMSQTGNDRHEMTDSLTQGVENELLTYMREYGDRDNYSLYRGIDYLVDGNVVVINTLSSWSLSVDMAYNFGPNIVHIEAHKEDVLIDTSLFIPEEVTGLLGGFPDEQEVILFPGEYALL